MSVMYYPDLHTECDIDSGPDTRAVGWLSPEKAYRTQPAAPGFLACLARHVETAWGPAASLSQHHCDFCGQALRREARPERSARQASEALWIPTEAAVYVAPAAILHYVSEHNYAPPHEFVLALLACPPQGSRRYFALLRGLPTWWSLMLGDHSIEEVAAQAAARRF
jgi:hypothetical protein